MLPFEWREMRRFGLSSTFLRLFLLRGIQSRSFRHSDGIIFLTEYARHKVQAVTGTLSGMVRVIPHGMNQRFVMPPRSQQPIEAYTNANPFRVLYVSVVDQYKHQWHVLDAVARLRQATGWPIQIEFAGPSYRPALARLQRSLFRFDPVGAWARYLGPVPHQELHQSYKAADMGVFASSCENMPNILLETMAAGLPIACSNRGPMPEVLGPNGTYFDPEEPNEISNALRSLIGDPQRRMEQSLSSFSMARKYTWETCFNKTFEFLAEVSRVHRRRLHEGQAN
jgi:glycosyltransferase involved in cell wall biosynthesis